MAEVFGYGDFQYTFAEDWAKLPQGKRLLECPGVVCDSEDRVFILTRGEDPIMVFDKDGNFLRSFGQGLFSNRTHGLYIAHDDSILAADDGIHTIQKFTPDGEKVMEIGERNHPAPRWSGQPFNRPTSAAIRPANGDIYISDGYGNSRIHCYTGDGQYKFSWGEPGIDAGQFIRPHNIAVDARRPHPGSGPRVPPGADFRSGRRLHHHVEQHPPPRRHGAVGQPHLHWRA